MLAVSNSPPVGRHDAVSFDSVGTRNNELVQHNVASRAPLLPLCVRSVVDCAGKILLGVIVVPIMAVVEMLGFAFVCAAVCCFQSLEISCNNGGRICGCITCVAMPILSVSVGLVMGTLGFCMGIIDGMSMVRSLSMNPVRETISMMKENIRNILDADWSVT
jgi:hypothetical protein